MLNEADGTVFSHPERLLPAELPPVAKRWPKLPDDAYNKAAVLLAAAIRSGIERADDAVHSRTVD